MSIRAMVFPGQGAQSVGMLAGFMENQVFADTLAQASTVVGRDLRCLIQEGPESLLNQTAVTQPVLLACSVGVYRCWRQAGGAVPDVMAGHSLGEYSALVCSGALPFAEAVALVAERGRLMQSAVPEGEGSMAAILGLGDAEVIAACAEVSQAESALGVVEAVNFNTVGQVVIAGARAAVEAAVVACKAKGARRSVLLQVSVPAHSSLMQSIAEPFAQALKRVALTLPSVRVLHNVDASVAVDQNDLLHKLLAQLYSPVCWTRTMEVMQQAGVQQILECGPGKVLCGLAKRLDGVVAMPLETPGLLDHALNTQ